MTDIVQQPGDESAAAVLKEGYLKVAYPYQGQVYRFTFYEGFVSSIVLRPQGGDPVVVYQQQGVYHVPQTIPGKLRGPDEKSTIHFWGGPDHLNIKLQVDDGPQDAEFQGPIQSITLKAKKKGSKAAAKSHGPSVTVIEGADEVAGISVEMKPGRGVSRGGVSAFEDDTDGDVVVVENSANTCPPHCTPKATTP